MAVTSVNIENYIKVMASGVHYDLIVRYFNTHTLQNIFNSRKYMLDVSNMISLDNTHNIYASSCPTKYSAKMMYDFLISNDIKYNIIICNFIPLYGHIYNETYGYFPINTIDIIKYKNYIIRCIKIEPLFNNIHTFIKFTINIKNDFIDKNIKFIVFIDFNTNSTYNTENDTFYKLVSYLYYKSVKYNINIQCSSGCGRVSYLLHALTLYKDFVNGKINDIEYLTTKYIHLRKYWRTKCRKSFCYADYLKEMIIFNTNYEYLKKYYLIDLQTIEDENEYFVIEENEFFKIISK